MNAPIKAIIIDDSQQARKLIRLMLLEFAPEMEVCAEAKNVNEGLQAIETYKPDVLFLDIEMPEKSGLDLAEELLAKKINCEIIFTTAYNEYAIKAFRLSAIDYLLKPIEETQLIEAVEKIKKKLNLHQVEDRLNILSQNLKSATDNVLCIPVLNGYEYIPLQRIEYLEADGSYVHIFLRDKKQKTVSKNLKYFEQALDQFSNFVRVHRSYIVNIDLMVSFSRSGRGTILLKNGKEVDLARDRRSSFLELLDKLGK